jgi:hypothetical protein
MKTRQHHRTNKIPITMQGSVGDAGISQFVRQTRIGRDSSCWQACGLIYGGSKNGPKTNTATDPGEKLTGRCALSCQRAALTLRVAQKDTEFSNGGVNPEKEGSTREGINQRTHQLEIGDGRASATARKQDRLSSRADRPHAFIFVRRRRTC